MRNEPTDFTAKIEHKEGRFYTLRFSDGQELHVPIFQIPKNAKLGDTVHLQLLTDSQAKQDKTELARALLEELLNGQ